MPIEPEPGGPFRSTEVFQCSNRVRIVFVPMPLPLPRFEVSADAQGAQHHAKHVQKGGAWDSNNLLGFSFRAQNCSGKKKQYHAKKRDGTKCQESKKSPGIDDCHVLSLRNKSHLCMYHHIIYAAFRMNYPAASSGVSKGTTMSEVKVKLLFKDFLIRTLVRDVLLDSFRIGVFAHRVRVETACPKVPAPKKLFHFFVSGKDFTSGNAFDYGHNLDHRHCWHALYEKMHMVLIHSNLHKTDFVPHGYPNADFPQRRRYALAEHLSSVLRRKYEMIQKQRFVMMFVDMFAHAYNIAHIESFLKPTQGSGY